MKWILNSSIDTLPTKTNLKQWGKLVNDKCFCGQRQTLNHILSCCSPSLEQGRFTFRHDNVLYYISTCLDKKRFKCFLDLDGQRTVAGGTIPSSLVVTVKKPDIVIVDQKCKSVNIFELTVPGETRLDTAHKLKTESYSHFVRDITSHTVTVTPFEVGAHTGHINNDNKKRLKTLHSFCTKDIKLKKFKENISAISILSSYYIFNCRNQEMWSTPDHILAPIPNQRIYVKLHTDKKPPSVKMQETCDNLFICINLLMRHFNFFIILLCKYSLKMNINNRLGYF